MLLLSITFEGDLPVKKKMSKSLLQCELIITKPLFFHFYIDFLKILWKTKNVPRPQGIVGNTKISVINAK